jgi:Rieske 2Fe-2S family protein
MTAISDLISAHRPGHALDQGFYLRDDVFARDMALLLGRWTCVGHASDIPKPGDYLTAELGMESAIIVRGEDGVVRALANVCRHRGSRICVEARGHAAIFACPYHAWTYHLDGALRRAREMPEGFDPADYGLKDLPILLVGGLIFISFLDDPPAVDRAAPALAAMTDRYGWAEAKVARRQTYAVRANWKLALENYHECYHCAPAHPEFSVLHALARPGGRRLEAEDVEAWGPAADGQEVFRVMRSGLAEGVATGSADGKAVAPLMGRAAYDGDCVFAELGLLSAFLAYPDHGLVYRFIPRGVLETEMEVIWLVRSDAVAGVDYDPAALTWLWNITSLADKKIIERNQAGVLSRHYSPGPFSLMEPGTRQYVDRYLAELARLENPHGV